MYKISLFCRLHSDNPHACQVSYVKVWALMEKRQTQEQNIGFQWLWESPTAKSYWAALLPFLRLAFPSLKILKVYLSRAHRFSLRPTFTTYCSWTYNEKQSPKDPGRIWETWKTLLGMEWNGMVLDKRRRNVIWGIGKFVNMDAITVDSRFTVWVTGKSPIKSLFDWLTKTETQHWSLLNEIDIRNNLKD